MKLGIGDEYLIRKIIRQHHRYVLRSLEFRSEVRAVRGFGTRHRLGILVRNLILYIRLIVDLTFSPAPAQIKDDVVVFYEWNRNVLEHRTRFLKWHLGNIVTAPITYSDSIQRGQNLGITVRYMLYLLVAILLSPIKEPSQFTPYLVSSMRVCFLVYSRIAALEDKEIYLFGLYKPETPFLSSFLKERGVKVQLIAASDPLSFDNKVLIGDSVKLAQPYQLDEFSSYRSLGTCKIAELWSPETYYRLVPYYLNVAQKEIYDKIGVYTQGMHLRERQGYLHPNFADLAMRAERDMLKTIWRYADTVPEIQVVIFPHPIERKHYLETGEHLLKSWAKASNIEIDLTADHDSTLKFDTVGLGITTFSSIGFERIFLGFRTLFYVSGIEYLSTNITSNYNELFFRDLNNFVAAIDEFRKISNAAFISKIGIEGYLQAYGRSQANTLRKKDPRSNLVSEDV